MTKIRGVLGLCALLAGASTGCYRNVGPVVTDVHMNNGTLKYTRCDLVVGSGVWIPLDELDHCVNETGKSVEAPAPNSP